MEEWTGIRLQDTCRAEALVSEGTDYEAIHQKFLPQFSAKQIYMKAHYGKTKLQQEEQHQEEDVRAMVAALQKIVCSQ